MSYWGISFLPTFHYSISPLNMVLVVDVDRAPTSALATEAYTLSQVGSASGRVLDYWSF